MAEVAAVTFEELPTVSETTPLRGTDLLVMAGWAADRKAYSQVLGQEAKKAGDDLDALWKHEAKTLVGTLDKPDVTQPMPEHITGVATVFGLKTAQLAAYDRLYNNRVNALNGALRDHFKAQDVEAVLRGDALDSGPFQHIHRLSHGGRSAGERVGEVAGRIVEVDIDQASMWVRTPAGEDFGAWFIPNAASTPLEIELRYPHAG